MQTILIAVQTNKQELISFVPNLNSLMMPRACLRLSVNVFNLPLVFHLFPLHSDLQSHFLDRRVRQTIARRFLAAVNRLNELLVRNVIEIQLVGHEKCRRVVCLLLVVWLALVFSYNQLISRETI